DQCEDLLELVENEHELRVVARQDPLQRAQEPPLAVLELLEQTGRRSVGHPEQRRLELLERLGAGEHLDAPPGLRAGQRSAPGSAPRRSAGTSPARTTDDLPLPLGPTTARKRVSRRRSIRCSVSASRPKKSAESASSKARRPL